MKNKFGILLAISSLPANHGIGDFGEYAYKFIDLLKSIKYSYWQVLPLNPLGPGNSPYVSFCSKAIDSRYICLDYLYKDGLIKKPTSFNKNAKSVDYQAVKIFKEKYLKEAYLNFTKTRSKELTTFIKNNTWVKAYAIFKCLANKNNFTAWNSWDKADMLYDVKCGFPKGYEEECRFYIFEQLIAYKQWRALVKYANKKGIKIIADCPFYVDYNSLDCWLNKGEFLFDENYNPTFVSGCPPDAFSDDGQLWGTPIYNFDVMKNNNYSFLIDRISFLASRCDLLRLDHFRAFDTYCVIPYGDENAKRGKWLNGPSYDFFDKLYSKNPSINIIAEDLGELFPSVLKLRDDYNLPGMYVIQFNILNEYNISSVNQIVYSGTHDNQTLKGWLKSLSIEDKEKLTKRFKCRNLLKAIMEYSKTIPSKITIFPIQDVMGLDDEARMNLPGSVGSPNWEWKLVKLPTIKQLLYK